MEQSQHKPKAGRVTSIENAEGGLATDVGAALLQKSRRDWWHFIMGTGGTLSP